MKNVGNTSRGRSQGVMKIFGHHVGLYSALRGHLCDSTAFLFSERVVDIWNGLSSHYTDFSSLPRFKRCINSMDFSDYLQFV